MLSRVTLLIALVASCHGFVNPSAMASRAVRAPTVAPTSPVMLFGFGKKEEAPKKGGRKVVKKTVKKAMGRTATKPVAKVAKKPVKKLAKGARPSFSADVKTNSGPLGTAKSFFSFGNNDKADNLKSQDNWAFQAFNILKDLPK